MPIQPYYSHKNSGYDAMSGSTPDTSLQDHHNQLYLQSVVPQQGFSDNELSSRF